MTNIVVPQLGESVVEARVARWLKKEGDRVEVGEPVVELETEKIDLEVNAERGGVIASIKHKEGDDVKIGELLAVVDESAPAPAVTPAGNGSKASQPAPPTQSAPPASPAQPASTSRATPTARRIAEDHDVNLASIQGSGAAGRVMKQDVEKAIVPAAKPAPAPAPVAQPGPSRKPAAARTGRPGERLEERQRVSERRATLPRPLVEAQPHAAARGPPRRPLQDPHGRGFGLVEDPPDPDPAAGGHSRPAQDSGPRGRLERAGRDSPDDVRGAQLRPPHRRWPRGRAIPREDQGVRRRSREPAAGILGGPEGPPLRTPPLYAPSTLPTCTGICGRAGARTSP